MSPSLLAIDQSRLNFRLAAYALGGMAVAGVVESVVGVGLLQVAVAAVVVVVAGGHGTLRARVTNMIVVTIIGGAFGFLSYVSAETAWQAALVLGVVSYLTGLGYAMSPGVGAVGYLLLLWTAAVLIGEAHGGDPTETAAAFLLGGVAAILVVAVAAGLRTTFGHGEDTLNRSPSRYLTRRSRSAEHRPCT